MAEDTPVGTEPLTANGILDILSDEIAEEPNADLLDDKDEIEEKPKKEAKEDKEEIKLDELGEDEKEEIPEEIELRTPVRRKEILAKYPQIFKDFPYLETAYYREQQYTEILPTIDDAKEAVERAEQLSNYERDLGTGSNESILKTIKDNNPQAFAKIVDNYLPNLAKVDQTAFYHVIGSIASSTIKSMVTEAERTSNDDLKAAALILNQFVFGKSEYVEQSRFAPDDKPNEALNSERESFVRERFSTASSDLQEKVNNVLSSTIDTHLDPKGQMTDYIRRNATKDCLANLEKAISGDTRFKAVLDNLWKKSFEQNFSRDSLDRIRSAYLSKAKSILPTLIQRTRSEALRGLTRGNREEKDRRGPIQPGKSSTPLSKDEKKSVIPRGMKTVDYLLQD